MVRALVRRRRPRWRAAVLLAVFAACAGLLSALHHDPRLVMPRAQAIAAVRHDPVAARVLARSHADRASVLAEDARTERVAFFHGGQVVLEAGVTAHGVDRMLLLDFSRGWHPYGNWIAYEPALLAGLTLLFLLTAAVVPLRQVRNLDALALVSLLGSVVLFELRCFQWMTVAAAPPMLYLAGRALWRGLAPHPDHAGRPPRPAVPLFLWACRHLPEDVPVRLLRMILAALAFVFIAVGVSSPGAVDVLYAVMEGATRLAHGVLPYGHMPGDIFHGDTYPPLSYALYAPLAALSPVGSSWDSVDPGLAAAVAAALAAAGGVWALAGRGVDGLLAATRWLAFPPLLIVVSTGTTDTVLALLIVLAIALVRRPGASTATLATAAWFKLAPLVLVPIWLAPLRGRRLARSVGALAGVSAATLGGVLALGGGSGFRAMVHAVSFQFTRGPFQSVWGAFGVPALQPLAEATTLTLIVAAAWRLRRAPELAADPERLAAITAGVLIALELSSSYWAFLYVVWFIPLLSFDAVLERRSAGIDRSSTAPFRPPALPQVAT